MLVDCKFFRVRRERSRDYRRHSDTEPRLQRDRVTVESPKGTVKFT